MRTEDEDRKMQRKSRYMRKTEAKNKERLKEMKKNGRQGKRNST